MADLKIGVLLCDHVNPDLRALTGGDYDALFEQFLTNAAVAVGIAIQVQAYDAIGGQLPADADECDAWLVSGSRADAFADDPWITALAAFLRATIENDGRVAGICFGHQIVARALGGKVERNPSWKVGPQRLRLRSTQWFDGCDVQVHAMHLDAVTQLPPGSTTIGRGTTAEFPAYLVGKNVFCMQDHPEFPDAYVEALIEQRRDRIGDEVSDAALATMQTKQTDGATIGKAIVSFLADRQS